MDLVREALDPEEGHEDLTRDLEQVAGMEDTVYADEEITDRTYIAGVGIVEPSGYSASD